MATTTHSPLQAAPDSRLVDTEGSSVCLSDYWGNSPIVLVFLRHYGCTFCREQIAALRQDYPQITAAGAEVICVGMGKPYVGKAFKILMSLPFPLLVCGEDLSIYRAYGLQRGKLFQLIGPGVIFRGIRAALNGNRQGKLEGDGFQLPGAFVIDTKGLIRFSHVNKDAADHVSNTAIVRALSEL